MAIILVGSGKVVRGFDKIRAATFAYTLTAFPMLTGTLVTIVGFVPVGFAGCSLTTRLQQCGFCG
jgi:multidrug efflux pump subunit AcrB